MHNERSHCCGLNQESQKMMTKSNLPPLPENQSSLPTLTDIKMRIRSKLFLLHQGLILISVCCLAGCCVPVIEGDYSMLSDNLIDDSIKKSHRNSFGTDTPEDFYRKFKTYFLEKFPISSPTHEAIAYLIKIGANCDHHNESTPNESYECTYQTKWLLVKDNCFYTEIFDEAFGSVLYQIIQTGNGGIADVTAMVKFETLSERKANKSNKSNNGN
jgi:hypothetical protein